MRVLPEIALSQGTSVTTGSCDDTLNQCVTQPRTDGTTCDDGLYCTISDQCAGGYVAGTLPRDCSGGRRSV